MTVHPLRVAILGAAAAAAAAFALPAPASAGPLPWGGGYMPTGCGTVTQVPAGIHIVDPTLPRLRSLGWFYAGANRGSRLAVGPGTTSSVMLVGRITGECSGVGFANNEPVPPETYTAGQVVIAGPVSALTRIMTWQRSGTGWDGTWTSEWMPNLTTASVGRYQPSLWQTAPAYQDFTVTLSGDWVSGTGSIPADYRSMIPDATTPLYIQRKTTLVEHLAASSVRTGRTVKVTGALKMANGAGYSVLPAATVYLQRKYGTGSWANVTHAHSNATGGVTFTYRVNRTAYLRLVYTGVLSGTFAAPVTSSALRVRAT
jgi:hypothetical protein